MVEKVAVVGLGYVGLPIMLSAARSGYSVFGIDLDGKKVEEVNSASIDFENIDKNEISKFIKSGMLMASTSFESIKDSKIILICVPTPLNFLRKPDLSFLELATKSISKYLTKNALIILESTVMPGTTRDFVIPILEEGSGLSRQDFHVAFSPERIDPANKIWKIENTPKLISGYTEKSRDLALNFYSKFIKTTIVCKSIEIAETAKLLENSFRFINISFINELSIFCEKLKIDIIDVIKAASTKPYGFMPFYPSVGVGGHCIPVDPLYLSNAAHEIGVSTKFIDLADQINQEMPSYFVGRAEEKIGGLNGKRVLVIGVSYKPNVADIRETPVEALILGLKNKGADVFWHDDLVKEWNGEKSVALSNDYDLAILATPHEYLDLNKLGDVPLLNTRASIK